MQYALKRSRLYAISYQWLTVTSVVSGTVLELQQSRLWDTPLSHLMPSLGVIPCKCVDGPYITKTRVNGLSVSEDSIILCSIVLTQYQRVTNRQTDGRTGRWTELL